MGVRGTPLKSPFVTLDEDLTVWAKEKEPVFGRKWLKMEVKISLIVRTRI